MHSVIFVAHLLLTDLVNEAAALMFLKGSFRFCRALAHHIVRNLSRIPAGRLDSRQKWSVSRQGSAEYSESIFQVAGF